MEKMINHPAVSVLKMFFAEMHDWETEAGNKYGKLFGSQTSTEEDLNRVTKELQSILEDVFLKYCNSGLKANRVENPHHHSIPPSYDPEKELILSLIEKEDKVIIETQQTHELKSKYMYEMVQRAGEWKVVDNRKIWFESESAWDEAPL